MWLEQCSQRSGKDHIWSRKCAANVVRLFTKDVRDHIENSSTAETTEISQGTLWLHARIWFSSDGIIGWGGSS